MALKDLESALAALTPAEKAQLVQSLALSLANPSPGIERIPEVMGGDACIVRTRIPRLAARELSPHGLVGGADPRELSQLACQ